MMPVGHLFRRGRLCVPPFLPLSDGLAGSGFPVRSLPGV